eukprot:15162985-Heterocapsa_arctica.AAC.1
MARPFLEKWCLSGLQCELCSPRSVWPGISLSRGPPCVCSWGITGPQVNPGAGITMCLRSTTTQL